MSIKVSPTPTGRSGQRALDSKRILISPRSLGYLYLIYAIIAFFTPAESYEDLIFEPYVAGHNYTMLIFALACVLFFRSGVALASFFQAKRHRSLSDAPSHVDWSTDTTIVLAVLVIVANLLSLATILRQNYAVLASTLLNGQAASADFKSEFISTDGMLAANPLLILVAWMLYSERLSGNGSRVIRNLMFVAILLSVVLSTIKLARYELVPLLIGIAIIKLRDVYRREPRTSVKRFQVTAVYVGLVVGTFMAFASIRDQGGGENTALANAVGYSIASFNRLSALLDGQLNLSYGGSGIYLLNFLSNLPVVGSAFASFLPSGSSVFAAEFADVEASGFVRSYNWTTMYGYYYADVGIWLFPLCLAFGVLAQVAFRNFVDGGVFGTLMYPYLAAALILSFSFYWVTRPLMASIVVFYGLYVLLSHVLAATSSRNAGKLRV